MNPSSIYNSAQPYIPRYPVYELANTALRALPPAARCLVQDFRDSSWPMNGLPADPTALENIARTFGFSRYMFRKFWPIVEKFFIEKDGSLVYCPDEEFRDRYEESRNKSREFGKLGVVAKRAKQSTMPFSASEDFHSPPPATLHQSDSRERSRTNTATTEETRGIGELETAVSAAAAEVPDDPKRLSVEECPNTRRLIASIFQDVTPEFINRLIQASEKVFMPLTDDTLAIAIRATFRGQKQTSAGLWLQTVPAYLANQPKPEPITQTSNRIPPEKEAHYHAYLAATSREERERIMQDMQKHRTATA